MSLPKDRDARNALPVWDGFIAYFPDVPAEVAKVSVLGNKQHNLGAKLHWNTHVSTDHKNKAFRHMLDDDHEPLDDDGCFHLAKAVWRLSAALQIRCWQRDGKNEHGEVIPEVIKGIMKVVGAETPNEAIDRLTGNFDESGAAFVSKHEYKKHDFFKPLGAGPLSPEEKNDFLRGNFGVPPKE